MNVSYPENYPENTEIRNISKFENNDDFYIFHAATKLIDNKIIISNLILK